MVDSFVFGMEVALRIVGASLGALVVILPLPFAIVAIVSTVTTALKKAPHQQEQ